MQGQLLCVALKIKSLTLLPKFQFKGANDELYQCNKSVAKRTY